MGTPVVVLEDVTVNYPRRPRPVLDRVSLRLEAGEQVIILGPSGAGKSTLLHLMTVVIPHSVATRFTGRVLVAGQDTAWTGVAELSRTVGILAQDPESAMCMPDVEREIALPLENHAVAQHLIDGLIDEVLEQVNGTTLKRRSTRQLSGGEGQRVALAASLVAEPPKASGGTAKPCSSLETMSAAGGPGELRGCAPFVRFWAASTVSDFGTYVTSVALPSGKDSSSNRLAITGWTERRTARAT